MHIPYSTILYSPHLPCWPEEVSMGRAKLEYDDSGTTFYYFLLSFYALILFPVTYFLYPRRKEVTEGKDFVCQCEPCLAKKARLDLAKPNQWASRYARYAVLVLLWSLLALMVYKALTADKDYVEYDPFEILKLDPEASMSEIKKQYRSLSKVYHPDKQGGNQDMFMRIAKAYEALTDEVSRENLKNYGNPDGPQAASFGIALPSWIVEKQNSLLVLAVYMGLFMIVLPSIVGIWWYKSIKYGSTNVLIQTSQLYAHFLNKSRTIPAKRLLMILTVAQEFNKAVSPLVPSRPSDDVELSKILSSKALPHVSIKTKEKYLSFPYAVKVRVLLHAHLERFPLHSSTLESDQRIILNKCPQLLQEMINILSQFWAYRRSRREPVPSLDLFEEVMRVSAMLVQAMWITGPGSIFLQLPHLNQALLTHFKTKKRKITSIDLLISLSSEERKSLLRTFTDEEYLDLMAVCARFPRVTIEAQTQVVDDDDTELVTVGSVITLSVVLKRTTLSEGEALLSHDQSQGQKEVETLCSHDGGEDNGHLPSSSLPAKNKRGKRGASAARKAKGQPGRRKAVNPKKAKKSGRIVPRESISDEEEEGVGGRGGGGGGGDKGEMRRRRTVEHPGREEEEEEEEEEGEGGGGEEEESRDEENDDEEEEWKRLQQSLQKHSKKKFEAVKSESHLVHAPYFHEDKFELWWLYVADKKKKEIICPPKKISGLMEDHMTELHFTAPERPGQYRYTLVLRSDSYIDLQFSKEVKLNVGAHKEVSGREQWADLEKEEEEEAVIEESLSEEEEESDSWEEEEESD